MVEKVLLQLCYTVYIQLSFKGFQKLVGGGEGRVQSPYSVRHCIYKHKPNGCALYMN